MFSPWREDASHLKYGGFGVSNHIASLSTGSLFAASGKDSPHREWGEDPASVVGPEFVEAGQINAVM